MPSQPPTSAESFPSPLPGWMRRLLAALSVFTIVTGLGMAVAALVIPANPVWVMFGFESVVAIAGVIGLLGASGRFDVGQGMTWACVAGTLFVAGVLSYLGTQQGIVWSGGKPATSTIPWALGRVALAGLFGAVAAYAVLRRSADGRQAIIRAIVALGLLGALGIGLVLFGGRVNAMLASVPGVLKAALAIVVGFAAIALLSAGGHWLIRAFECARTPDAPRGVTPTPGARAS